MLNFIHAIIQALFGFLFGKQAEAAGYEPTPPEELNDDYYDAEGNIPSVPDEFEVYAEKYSKLYQVPKPLLCAVAFCESSFRLNSTRHEPAFQRRYVDNNPTYSGLPLSERVFLSSSFGWFQIMGLTAIETLGATFSSPNEILDPDINTQLGAYYLRKLYNKYHSWEDSVSAYNQGNNRKNPDGSYVNQIYVDKVLKYWDKYMKETSLNG